MPRIPLIDIVQQSLENSKRPPERFCLSRLPIENALTIVKLKLLKRAV